MKNFKAVFGIMLVFMLGSATGAIVMHMIDRAELEASISGNSDVRERVLLSRLTRKLNLDRQQQAQVRTILHENHVAIHEIKKQFKPQIVAIVEHGQARINAILTPEQQAVFREISLHHTPRGGTDSKKIQ